MNLVNLERAVKSFGDRPLLAGVSAGVAAGERIGVVGRNGAGKSTLLAVLAGREPLDEGRVTRARDLRIGHLSQRDELSGTVAGLVTGTAQEHVWAANPRARAVMAALLPGIALDSHAHRLSGGESRRVALAGLLVAEHDLLLLDEPTNHLDVEAIDWLAGYLRELAVAMVVVTHDRWFLDAVCDRTWELTSGQLRSYDGGYAAYVLARAERARLEDAAERRRRNLLRKELAWLRRGPPARTSKPRFRIEAANELIAGEPPARDGVELARLATARLGKTVLDAEDLTVRAGERTLLEHVTWQLGPGQRVGLAGPNGSGKSTLLRLLARSVAPGGEPAAGSGEEMTGEEMTGEEMTGEGGAAQAVRGQAVTGQVVRGKTVRLGYLAQDSAGLDPELTPREAVAGGAGAVLTAQAAAAASQLLDRLGLRGDTQWTPARALSGGERRRLQLLTVLAGEPNVLLLDEPTNDLDTDTLTELEDLLDGWPGSLLVVSHDRYFLERVTDQVAALLGDGKLSYLGGGITEYLERVARREPPAVPGTPPGAARGTRPGAATGQSPGGARGAGGRTAAADDSAGSPAPAAAQRAARKELQRLERQLERLAVNETELTAALAAQASDYGALIELGARLREIQEEKAMAEERWLAVAEDLPDG